MQNDPLSFLAPRGQMVLALAREEALRLNHNYIDSAHILLGLLLEVDGGAAAPVLAALGLRIERARAVAASCVGLGSRPVVTKIELTSTAHDVLEAAAYEALRWEHHTIDTIDLLLGLIREADPLFVTIIARLGVTPEQIRHHMVEVLGPPVGGLSSTDQTPFHFYPGQTVRIIKGPFDTFVGTILVVEPDRQKVLVSLTLFDRSSSLHFDVRHVIPA